MSIASNEMNVLVRPDSYLTLHYRITLASGPGKDSVFTDTFDGRPATLQMGSGQWAPGLETALLGKAEGDRFSVTLEPADAYGDRNPELIQRVTRMALACARLPFTGWRSLPASARRAAPPCQGGLA